jgi:hypothetical protein
VHAQSASNAYGVLQSLLILGVIGVLSSMVGALFARQYRDRAKSARARAQPPSVRHENQGVAWIAAAVASLIAFLGLGVAMSLIALVLQPRFEVSWGDNSTYAPVIFGIAMQSLRLAGAALIGLFAWRIVAKRHATEPIAASSASVAATAPVARRGSWILVAVIVAVALTGIAGCIGSILVYGMAGREGPPAPTMVTPAVPEQSADPTRDR